MRVAVAGGGPGGLFFATLIRQADPSVEVTVFERNRADDTFGFGVVFSDRTLAGIHEADPVLREALTEHGRHWDEIEVRLKGRAHPLRRQRDGGRRATHLAGVDAGPRPRRRRAAALLDGGRPRRPRGLRPGRRRGRRRLEAPRELCRDHGADLGVEVETATAKFIWFGTDYLFDGLTFVHERSQDGVFAVHGYPISDAVSTFIVETDEASWRRAGLDEFDVTQPPGPSDMVTKDYLEKLFADQIDGKRLLTNNSRWGNFRTRRTKRWHTLAPQPVAFLGDAVHTAHFSVGSGTKMAMEDAVALSAALAAHPGDLAGALATYEETAQPSVRKIQDSARPSLSWWEHFGRYHDAFEPWQFAYHFLSRSISDARLGRRAPDFVAASHRGWVDTYGAEPLQTAFQRRGWSAPGRLVEVRRTEAGPSPSPGTRRSLSEIRDRAPGVRCWRPPTARPGCPVSPHSSASSPGWTSRRCSSPCTAAPP